MSDKPLDSKKPEVAVTITDIQLGGADDAPQVDLQLGAPEDRYEVLDLLGAGGMGEVFEARDRLFDRHVALKFMRDSAARSQFFREAKTSGLLNHPNIPPVYDLGIDSGGRPFYAMQLIRGRTLAEVLNERMHGGSRWSLPRMLTLFQSACAALAYAHDRGLVHLDVKPANVMIGELQQLYVVDWGLCASESEQLEQIRGTPAYMSPEQALGAGALGPASDVFCAGTVLYEICAGSRAFPGDTADRVMATVKVGQFCRDEQWDVIPSELREIISGTLCVEPKDRPTATELSEQVQQFLEGTREERRRRDSAIEVLDQAETEIARRDKLLARLQQLIRRVESLRPESWLPTTERAAFWRAEDAVEETRIESEIALQRAVAHLLEAQRNAPEDPEVRERLGEIYWPRFLEAEADGDFFQAEFFRGQLERLRLESYQDRLSAGGRAIIHCQPRPDRAVLRRLEERERLLRSVEEWTLANTDPLATPELELGSYEVEIEADGFSTTVVPLRVERESTTTVRLRLRTREEVGEEFVWVPGGPFTMGGDSATFESVPRALVFVDDFYIQKYPVTWLQYREYLQNRFDAGEPIDEWLPIKSSVAKWRVEDDRVVFTIDPEFEKARRQWPIFSVTHGQSLEFCRWHSDRDGRAYDLPTDAEWEKAARGVDGRIFPWGNRFDPSLCRNSGSNEGKAQPGPVGEYETDRSPYGVCDMAGGIKEWCSSWFNEKDDMRLVRGGAWNFGEIGTHCAYRFACTPSHAYQFIGFRLVHR